MSTYVTLDGYNVFPAALIADDTWNGYVTPGFTRAQADVLAAYLATEQATHPDTEVPVWNGTRQHYTISSPAYPDEAPELVTADDDGLYRIGAHQWTWTVYDGDPERDTILGEAVVHEAGPTDDDYAEFGRAVHALLGAPDEELNGGDLVEDVCAAAAQHLNYGK